MDEPLKGSEAYQRNVDKKVNKFTLMKYLANGHVHGIKYLGRKDKIEIFFWTIILVISIFFAALFIMQLFDNESNAMIKAQLPPKSIRNLPFPAITICSETKSQKKLADFTQAYHIYHPEESNETLNDVEASQIEALSQVCDPHLFEGVKIAENPTNGKEFLKILRNISVGPDMILFCKFKSELEPCDELFKEVVTDDGICYTFNMLEHSQMFKGNDEPASWDVSDGYESDDHDVYPNRASGSVESSLNIVVNTKRSDMDFICKGPVQGYKVKVHSPDEFPRMSTGYFRLPLNSEALVRVTPGLTLTAPKAQSHCHTSSTKVLENYKKYSHENCLTECLRDFTLAECGCVKFSMIHEAKTAICDQHHSKCVSDAIKKFNTNSTSIDEFPCDCKPACNTLKFDSKVSEATFDFTRVFQSYGADLEEFPEATLSRLTVFLEDEFYTASYLTQQDSSTIDIIAKIGGIVAFFLGASCISILEIFFYFVRRFVG